MYLIKIKNVEYEFDFDGEYFYFLGSDFIDNISEDYLLAYHNSHFSTSHHFIFKRHDNLVNLALDYYIQNEGVDGFIYSIPIRHVSLANKFIKLKGMGNSFYFSSDELSDEQLQIMFLVYCYFLASYIFFMTFVFVENTKGLKSYLKQGDTKIFKKLSIKKLQQSKLNFSSPIFERSVNVAKEEIQKIINKGLN